MVGQTVSHYRIVGKLGEGGMGVVYLAEDTKLDRQVALKILPEDFAQDITRMARFEREAKVAASLTHENICTIHEVGETGGRPFIAMEYIEGVTLKERLSKEALEVEEALDIGIQIADALNEARKKGIVHRDIKSGNVMLTERKQVKVLDFGLAKQSPPEEPEKISEVPTVTELTQAGVILGTVSYMSPEQVLGKEVDHRSDIFSFGVMLYEMLTGRMPFHGDSSTEVMDAILHKDSPPVARYNDKTPDELMRIVRKMLEKKREERYQSAYDVWVDLRRVKRDSQTGELAIGKRPRAGGWPLRVTAALMMAAAVVALIMFWPSQEGMMPTAEASSVAALPCDLFGLEEQDSYLTNAVSHSISTLLGQLDGLETKVPISDMEFEKIGKDLQKLAAVYNVGTFVQSQMTAERDRWILNVQLVEPQTRKQLWSRQYEGPRENYNQLMRLAAEGIRQALKPEASPTNLETGLAATSEAQRAYEKGLHYSNRYNNLHRQPDFDIAYEAFHTALELDPGLADAAAEIADLHIFKIEAGAPAAETAPEGDKWARLALEINPQCGKAWANLAWLEVEGNPRASMRKVLLYSLKAASLAPQDAMIPNTLAHSLNSFSLALAASRESYRLNPLYLHGRTGMATYLYNLGRSDEGLPILQGALDIEPDMAWTLFISVFQLLDLGRIDEAGGHFARVHGFAAAGSFPASLLPLAEHALALARNDHSKAEEALGRVMVMVENPRTTTHELQFVLEYSVPILAEYGKKEPAITILSRIAEAGVIFPYDWFRLNPKLDPLRGDPRFEEILSLSQALFEETLDILEEARSRGEFPRYLEKPLADVRRQLGIERNRLLQRMRDEKRRGRNLAKMDAFERGSLLESGTYYVVPEGVDLAKMDALWRKYLLIPAT